MVVFNNNTGIGTLAKNILRGLMRFSIQKENTDEVFWKDVQS